MKKLLISLALAAVVLFGASFALRGVAEDRAQAEHLWLMQTLLPGSEGFTRLTDTGEDETIRSIHKAENGFVIETVTNGYAGPITMLIGVSNDGKVTGLVVREAHETFGLGSKVLTDHAFLAQFLNSSGSFAVAAQDADAFSGATGTVAESDDAVEVDAITGATVTSKAVVRSVNAAVAYVTGADASSGATSWGG